MVALPFFPGRPKNWGKGLTASEIMRLRTAKCMSLRGKRAFCNLPRSAVPERFCHLPMPHEATKCSTPTTNKNNPFVVNLHARINEQADAGEAHQMLNLDMFT